MYSSNHNNRCVVLEWILPSIGIKEKYKDDIIYRHYWLAWGNRHAQLNIRHKSGSYSVQVVSSDKFMDMHAFLSTIWTAQEEQSSFCGVIGLLFRRSMYHIWEEINRALKFQCGTCSPIYI